MADSASNFSSCIAPIFNDAPSELVTVAFLFTLTLGGFDADLLVVFLQRCKILTSLGELAFLHPFPDVPVYEGALGIHKIELVVDTGHNLRDGRRVADHAKRTHYLGEITARYDGWRLVVD